MAVTSNTIAKRAARGSSNVLWRVVRGVVRRAKTVGASCGRQFGQWRLKRDCRKARRVLSRFPRPLKLHLGCGTVQLRGWVNIDADPTLQTPDVVWDLTRSIPVEDDSCAMIYCEHFLEHVPVENAISLLRECHRALLTGGVLRIAMPSLDALIEQSYRGRWRDQDWLMLPEYRFIRTRAEMLNVAFRWWGHQWLYDREELHRRLREAGFRLVHDRDWGRSPVPDLNNRETRSESLLICETEKR